jgi:hypothetical protein
MLPHRLSDPSIGQCNRLHRYLLQITHSSGQMSQSFDILSPGRSACHQIHRNVLRRRLESVQGIAQCFPRVTCQQHLIGSDPPLDGKTPRLVCALSV